MSEKKQRSKGAAPSPEAEATSKPKAKAPDRGEKSFRELKIRLAMAIFREDRKAAEARVRRCSASARKQEDETVKLKDFFAD